MGILTRDEIIKMMARDGDPHGPLVVTPLLDGTDQIRSASIDLRLGNDFLVSRRSHLQAFDIAAQAGRLVSASPNQQELHVRYGQKFVLHPGELVLGSTLEYLAMPLDAVGSVKTRSTWGRLGISILTSSQVAAGFKGTLTLELLNVGGAPVVLYPCVRIAHLVLHQIVPITKPDESEYMMNVGPSPGILRDEELRALTVPPRQVIIGVTGGMGSYTQLIADDLVKWYGFVSFSLSHLVRREAARLHQEPLGKNLRQVGNQLRKSFGNDVLVRRLLERIRREVTSPFVVIEGIRNPSEAKAILEQRDAFLIGADATLEKRYERVTERQDWSEWSAKPTRDEVEAVLKSDMDDGNEHGVRVRACLDMARDLSNDGRGGFYFDSDKMDVPDIHPRIETIIREIEKKTGLRIIERGDAAV